MVTKDHPGQSDTCRGVIMKESLKENFGNEYSEIHLTFTISIVFQQINVILKPPLAFILFQIMSIDQYYWKHIPAK